MIPQAVLLPALAGAAIAEVAPATAAALRPLCTLCAGALMALHCGSYVAHCSGALLYAWPQLLGAVAAMHAGAKCCLVLRPLCMPMYASVLPPPQEQSQGARLRFLSCRELCFGLWPVPGAGPARGGGALQLHTSGHAVRGWQRRAAGC